MQFANDNGCKKEPKASQKTKDRAGLKDKLIGRRVRELRILRGVSQTELARRIGGVTFQQIQKYEAGGNKLSAARLVDIGAALAIPVERFLETCTPHRRMLGDARFLKKESVLLLKHYYAIHDEALRGSVLAMLRCLAAVEKQAIDSAG